MIGYKEKYEQGLECIQEILESGEEQIKMTLLKERLLPFFPELETENEKMRRKCINFLNLHKRFHASSTEIDDCIAWLKKQKEIDKEIVFRPLAGTDIIAAARQALEKIEIGKEVVLAFNGAYIHVNGKTVAEICNEYFSWVEKQGEQKVPINDFKAKNWYVSEVDGKIHDMTYNPADKVEPKFKVGDWIVQENIGVYKIIEVCESWYEVISYINGRQYSIAFDYEYMCHLWTIQDAKDGDVLVDDLGNICIYQEPSTKLMYHSYCYGKYNYFVDRGGSHEIVGTCPATKEQRNLLFQRMKEAGYEWDAEKKVFKTIDENSKCDVVEYVYILDYCSGRVIVAKHDTEETIETLFKKLGLKESQCHYMVSSNVLSIEYINF